LTQSRDYYYYYYYYYSSLPIYLPTFIRIVVGSPRSSLEGLVRNGFGNCGG
jgi:hypothetical protein